jgi:Flp pilus assembly protein TadG
MYEARQGTFEAARVGAGEPEGDMPAGLVGWLRGRIRADESGLALIWASMFLIVMLGFAALAVDIGHGYAVAQRAQNAADAASLAGTVYLPGDVGGAYDAAQTVAATNGFTNGANGVQVIPAQQPKLSQLKVTVKESVKTWFAKALGFATMDISRSATADYNPPVAMGSPSNQYGNDPESGGAPASTTYPNFWGNVSAQGSTKISGDAYTSNNCGSNPDNCTGSNTDFDPNGYYYAFHFNSAATVKVQVFDPGFVAVGDNCGAGGATDYNAGLATAAGLKSNQVKGWPAGITFNASARYAPEVSASDPADTSHPGTRYCTGDQPFSVGASNTADTMPTTTYTMLGPATVAGEPSTAGPAAGCSRQVFPPFGGTPSNTVAQQLQSSTKINVSPTPQYLATYFRQWYTICTITGAANSDYFLQINGDSTGKGHNRFALRASGGAAGAVSVYGNAKMAIYANAGSNTLTQFYLSRIPTNDRGHILDLFLFDIGDAGSTGSLTIVPPSESTGSPISGCTYTPPPGNSTGPPWGSTSLMSGCAITGVNSAYNGQWIEINVPIPSNYACNDASPTGCWFRINYLFSGTVNDTTSWAAQLEGDPVRIVK